MARVVCSCPEVRYWDVIDREATARCWSCGERFVEVDPDSLTPLAPAPVAEPVVSETTSDAASTHRQCVPQTAKELVTCARELLGIERNTVVQTTVLLCGDLVDRPSRTSEEIAIVWAALLDMAHSAPCSTSAA